MAYKVFSNGDALTGGELNTFLMNQSVIQFASTAARDAAIPAPNEGQLVWLQDSDKYVYYTGSAWADLITPAGGDNAIINGAFDIWQRGTTTSTDGAFLADRWFVSKNTASSLTYSQQTFTPGAAPVAGYEGSYFARVATGTGSDTSAFLTKVEDVRTLAGQTVSMSFWAKAAASVSVTVRADQNFGTGGSTGVATTVGTASVTTSWQRFTFTFANPSISGKTIGTGSYLMPFFYWSNTSAVTLDIWGVQLESGSTATPFKRNASNIQGELAACQRYYWRQGNAQYASYGSGTASNSGQVEMIVKNPVTMRSGPAAIEHSNLAVFDGVTVTGTPTSLLVVPLNSSPDMTYITFAKSGSFTQYRPYFLLNNNNTAGYFAVSAEL